MDIVDQVAAILLALLALTLLYLVLADLFFAPSIVVWLLAGLGGVIIYEYVLEWLESRRPRS
ncbi:MAG: hypothetical protein JRM80_06525 [Nitrososphaerota archaeon]|nr:hypothetical protein [Nitrososphaerota archaeon]